MQFLQSMFPRALLGAIVAATAGCSSGNGAAGSSNHDASAPPAGDAAPNVVDGATSPEATDEASDDDAEPTTTPQASVRIAHLSPDAPAIDVCLAPHGTTDFQGPMLGPLAQTMATGDAGADAILSYSQISAYFSVDAGQYDLRVVAAGATSCDVPLGSDGGAVSDATHLPSIAPNTFTTIMAVGAIAPAGDDHGFVWSAITDDAVLLGGAAVLRAVNAQPSTPTEDFGFGSAAGGWLPLLTNVSFGSASAQAGPGQGVVDANGYLAIAPLSAQVVSCRAVTDAAGDSAIANALSIAQGSVATLFSIGGDAAGARMSQLLLCVDNEPSGGALSDCSIAP